MIWFHQGNREGGVTKRSDFLSTHLPSVAEDAPVHEIMDLMRTRRVHLIPFVKNEKLVGLATRRDMITAYLNTTTEPAKTL